MNKNFEDRCNCGCVNHGPVYHIGCSICKNGCPNEEMPHPFKNSLVTRREMERIMFTTPVQIDKNINCSCCGNSPTTNWSHNSGSCSTCDEGCPNEEVMDPNGYGSISRRARDKIIADQMSEFDKLITMCIFELENVLNYSHFFMEGIPSVHYDYYNHIYYFTIKSPYLIVSEFKLQPLPGCSSICLSTDSSVKEEFRGRGIASILNEFRKKIAKYLGYNVLMCTYIDDNLPQKKLLSKNGWTDLLSFDSSKTGHKINLSTVVL